MTTWRQLIRCRLASSSAGQPAPAAGRVAGPPGRPVRGWAVRARARLPARRDRRPAARPARL